MARSLVLTRPTLASFTADPTELRESAAELFDVVQSGKVKVHINLRMPLADAGKAQTLLESRKTTGSAVLLP